MIYTHRKLDRPSVIQQLEIRTSEGTFLEITVATVIIDGQATIMISNQDLFSRLTLPVGLALTLKPADLWTVKLDFECAGAKEIDAESSIIEAVRLIHEMHKQGHFDQERFVEHLEAISLHQACYDIQGVVTYLHFSDLPDVATDCIVYEHDRAQLLTWTTVWPKVKRVIMDLTRNGVTIG